MSLHKIIYFWLLVSLFSIQGCSQFSDEGDADVPSPTKPPLTVTSVETEPTPSATIMQSEPTAQQENVFSGLWICLRDELELLYFDFINEKKVVYSREIIDYEVLSGSGFVVYRQSEELLFRIIQYDKDKLSLQTSSLNQTNTMLECTRQAVVDKLAEKIIGSWELKEGDQLVDRLIFGDEGELVTSFRRGRYEVVSKNGIRIMVDSEHQEDILFFRPSEVNPRGNLELVIGENQSASLTKMSEVNNVAEELVGVWQNENWGEIEFTSTGKLVIYLTGKVAPYEVIGNAVLVTVSGEVISQDGTKQDFKHEQAFIVKELNDNQMTWRDFQGEQFGGEQFVQFTRKK